MKPLMSVEVQVSIIDEGYQSEYAAISLPVGGSRESFILGLQGVVPALYEGAMEKRNKKLIAEMQKMATPTAPAAAGAVEEAPF